MFLRIIHVVITFAFANVVEGVGTYPCNITESLGSGVATQYRALGFLHEMPPPLNTVVEAD